VSFRPAYSKLAIDYIVGHEPIIIDYGRVVSGVSAGCKTLPANGFNAVYTAQSCDTMTTTGLTLSKQ